MSLYHSKSVALLAIAISVFCSAPSVSLASDIAVGETEMVVAKNETPRTRYGSEEKTGRSAASAKYYTLGDTKKPYIPWTFPGINISSPTGYGANWGAVFIGGGYQNRARFTDTGDGALGAGLGLGDSKEYVGVQVDVSILSLNNADRGGLTLKLHRMLPYNFGIAFGVENVASWGGTSDAPRSYYGSISRVFLLSPDPEEVFSALTLTAGVGSGRFQSESNVLLGRDSVGVFGSAALRVAEPLSFIADWTGQDLNLGLSITPLREWGLFINPSIADVTGNAGNGVRYLIGVGFAYIFV